MTEDVDADYLVVGAGATGLAFADALTQHRADGARVAMVDRRHGVGGHWLEAYPFVRLHQASSFYGVASRQLGGARMQVRGPEAGLFARAGQAEICDYYARLADDLLGTDRVRLFTGCEYDGGRGFTSLVSGRQYTVPESCRIVDARYLAPDIPAEQPPRFGVGEGSRVVAVNELVHVQDAPSRYVVVGSGKTATDAIVWLLGQSVDPGAICWVRPRDPWMLDRARVQPDPAVFTAMSADVMRSAAGATSLDDVFLRLEDAGVMMRIDRTVTPTMAKAPTLGQWELELLRTVEDVVRLGHMVSVEQGRIELTDGSVDVPDDALVVNCAADGLRTRPTVPIWSPESITLQPVRAGFPCFGAALIGYVEATRAGGAGGDAVKNATCSPSRFGNSLTHWAQMTLVGARNAAVFNAEPDIRSWANDCALNPARVPSDYGPSADLDAAQARLAQWAGPGLARLAELVG